MGGAAENSWTGLPLEWDLDYPYFPPDLVDITKDSRGEWEDDLVCEYMHVPKPLRGPHSDQAWT